MSNDLCKVALVIPVHNRREITLQCLRSLARIDSTDLDVRVFIVDDGSMDGTSDAIRDAFPDVILIKGSGSLHYAGGTNLGIEEALKWNPSYLVLMNDDAVFHESFLLRLVNTARAKPRSIVGALLLLWDVPHRAFQVCPSWNTWKGGWQIPADLTVFDFPKTPIHVECLVGNCVLVPVEALRECGLMDAKKFPYGWGDAQYFMRMRKAGWRLLLDPTAYVWCEPNTYPEALNTLPISKILSVLFVNERHPANLKRQFVAVWNSAPNKFFGLAAFVMHCLLLVIKILVYGIRSLTSKNRKTENSTDA